MSLIQILALLNERFTFFVIFPSFLLLGLYLSWRLRFVQVFRLGSSVKKLFQKREGDGITHYQAVAAVLAGNFGTGNIAGMAVALSQGGPGALVWMWIIAFFGAAIQYASCILGVKYREKNERGEFVGGPMYYLKALGMRRTAALFALFAFLGALTVGNFAQVHSVALPLEDMGIPPLATGLVMALFVGFVLLGGMQRFAKLAASIVPLMAFLYFGAAMIILIGHGSLILPALALIFKAAFSSSALVGGALGYGVMKTVTSGFERGIFATDAGTGIAPILQSSTESDDSYANGIATLVAPILVMIVCTTTALVLIITGAWQMGYESTNMVTCAFNQGLNSSIGSHIVTLALLLFSYTTILAWANCAERAVDYLMGSRFIKAFRWFFILMIPCGVFMHVSQVWLLSDISISLMLATNMLGVALLSKKVVLETRAANA